MKYEFQNIYLEYEDFCTKDTLTDFEESEDIEYNKEESDDKLSEYFFHFESHHFHRPGNGAMLFFRIDFNIFQYQ